jgi:hypothetical protein
MQPTSYLGQALARLVALLDATSNQALSSLKTAHSCHIFVQHSANRTNLMLSRNREAVGNTKSRSSETLYKFNVNSTNPIANPLVERQEGVRSLHQSGVTVWSAPYCVAIENLRYTRLIINSCAIDTRFSNW